MPARHVIVDGSNLATEGRSFPSLEQLDQAVRDFVTENPDATVTVVVDASFGHRIDPSERQIFEGAEEAGELVSPPAGAIGRGDAFLLRIAEKMGATVLSNDSFQEFHATHPWLFEKGRLIGGKPVPGVGWVFMVRSPVRGPRSREMEKEAKRKKRDTDGAGAASGGGAARGGDVVGLDLAAAKGKRKKVDRAIATATAEVVEPASTGGRRRRRRAEAASEPVNEPLAFIAFIASHPLGSEVAGTVEEYSSHGAYVRVEGARAYLPLSSMGDPPPRKAREAVTKGTERAFIVQALDPPRRGIELAIPGFARVAGLPKPETVEAEIHADHAGQTAGGVARATRQAPAGPKKAAAGKKVTAKKAQAPAKKSPAKKAQATKKSQAGGKGEAVKRVPEPAKKAAPRKAQAARKAKTSATKTSAKKAQASKKAGAPAKKAPAKAAHKSDASVQKVQAAAGNNAPPKRSPQPKKVAAANAKRAPAKRQPAKRAPAKRAAR